MDGFQTLASIAGEYQDLSLISVLALAVVTLWGIVKSNMKDVKTHLENCHRSHSEQAQRIETQATQIAEHQVTIADMKSEIRENRAFVEGHQQAREDLVLGLRELSAAVLNMLNESKGDTHGSDDDQGG